MPPEYLNASDEANGDSRSFGEEGENERGKEDEESKKSGGGDQDEDGGGSGSGYEDDDGEDSGGGGDNDDDDSISETSCDSDISSLSGESWKPISNHIKWVQLQMEKNIRPKDIILQLTGQVVPDEVDDMTALKFIIRFLDSRVRPKLSHINTIDDAVSLINRSSNIIVLTGAGVSVSCGIPDFRSRNGIYARLSKDFPDLPDPQSMFDIHYFKRNPYPFFKFAKEIYPGQFSPSPSHKFIRCIEQKGKLLRNYSQNIDTLEQAAGIEKLITCHGSFATASCTNCRFQVDSNAIKEDIIAQRIPLCPRCNTNDDAADYSIMPVMKPDIVFFGEGLSDEFHNSMTLDKDQCDLLIVIGSSLKVRPVALIPNSIPDDCPQILINREPLDHLNFDIELLGDCDIIVKYLCEKLGEEWTESCFGPKEAAGTFETSEAAISKTEDELPFKFTAPNRYVFKGAELSFYDNDNDDDDEEVDDVNEEDQDNQNDSENESEIENSTNGSNNLNATSDESVSLQSSFETSVADTSSSSFSMNRTDDGNFCLKFKTLDAENVPPAEHGIGKSITSPLHSSFECSNTTTTYPSREKKEKRESIENYSPNSF